MIPIKAAMTLESAALAATWEQEEEDGMVTVVNYNAQVLAPVEG